MLLDETLASLYGVEVKALNQAVTRNIDRFPGDFMFQLSSEEASVLRSQTVTSSVAHGGRRYLPRAFCLPTAFLGQLGLAEDDQMMRPRQLCQQC